MQLMDLFDQSLVGRASRGAVEFQGNTWTFGELDALSRKFAGALVARGFERGDRLCAYLPNSIELIGLFLACVRLGVIYVPVNILYRERELEHIVRDAEPRLFVDSGVLGKLTG